MPLQASSTLLRAPMNEFQVATIQMIRRTSAPPIR
jgi:hypothetical protein